jgi:hypothetical protein
MSRETTRETRIENLKKTQAARKEDARKRVDKAIERLEKTGGKINFHTIAREANLSVSYLYKYPELKQHIAELRNKQSHLPPPPKPVSSKSHDRVLARLKERIKKLEKDNRELRRKNEALAGQVYRVHQLQEQVERQQETIEDLQARLAEAHEQKPVAKVTPISSKIKSSVSDKIKAELNSLGIKLNGTLTKKIKASTEETVLAAIEALKDQLNRGEVKNPGGWLAKAIEGGWTKAESITQQETVTQPEIFTASPESEKELVSVDKLKALSSIFGEKDDLS